MLDTPAHASGAPGGTPPLAHEALATRRAISKSSPGFYPW
jgi:hypothetical protein